MKCFCSSLFGLIRSVSIARQLCKGEFDTLSPVTLAFLTGVCVGTNNYLCAAYAIERVLATVFVKRYEKWRPYLGVLSSVAIVSCGCNIGVPFRVVSRKVKSRKCRVRGDFRTKDGVFAGRKRCQRVT